MEGGVRVRRMVRTRDRVGVGDGDRVRVGVRVRVRVRVRARVRARVRHPPRLAAQRADELRRDVDGREGGAQRGAWQQHAARGRAVGGRGHVEGGEATQLRLGGRQG